MENGIHMSITSASGVRTENVSLEDAAALCLNQMKNEKQWLKIENEDGTSSMVKSVDLTEDEETQIRAMLGSAVRVTSVSPLTGGYDDEGRWEAEVFFNDPEAPTISADVDSGKIRVNGSDGTTAIESTLINIIKLGQNGLGALLKGQAQVATA